MSLPALLVWTAFVRASEHLASRQRPATPPSAASFYVPQVPSLVRDPSSPLHVWAGHISADPEAKVSPATQITAQLYFVFTKARRTADKERLIVWFNVRRWPPHERIPTSIDRWWSRVLDSLGRSWLLVIRWADDGGWSLEDGREGLHQAEGRRMGRIRECALRFVSILHCTFSGFYSSTGG